MNNFDMLKEITDKQSKKSVLHEVMNSIKGLDAEMEMVKNPFGFDDCVCLREEFWSEVAKCLVALNKITVQHAKNREVVQAVEIKLSRDISKNW